MTENIILLVDDNPVNVELLEEVLVANGYGVVTALSGAEAIEKAKTHKPDLVVLDIAMPDMDGFEVMGILSSDDSTRDIPVIFVTALNDSEDMMRGLSMGAVDYITKPFVVQEALSRITACLKNR